MVIIIGEFTVEKIFGIISSESFSHPFITNQVYIVDVSLPI